MSNLPTPRCPDCGAVPLHLGCTVPFHNEDCPQRRTPAARPCKHGYEPPKGATGGFVVTTCPACVHDEQMSYQRRTADALERIAAVFEPTGVPVRAPAIGEELEEQIEKAFWSFDHDQKAGGVSERDAFKGQMRALLRSTMRNPAPMRPIAGRLADHAARVLDRAVQWLRSDGWR